MSYLLIAWLSLMAADDAVVPLPQAHAHNDYLHARPLLDALDHGFCSVEADVYLTPDGKLLVAHERSQLKPERTLEALYLRPLRERAKKYGGKIYPNGPPLLLLIDLKSEARPTYAVLHHLLEAYADLLTEVRGGVVTERAVTVVISGNRPPLDELAKQSPRFTGYDGRLSDLARDVPAHLMPLISDNWSLKFNWNGIGPIPVKERVRIQDIIRQAHARGRKVRFWATPEKPEVWEALLDLQVDYLNTDKISELRSLLLRQRARP